jgi:hypothetical protein
MPDRWDIARDSNKVVGTCWTRIALPGHNLERFGTLLYIGRPCKDFLVDNRHLNDSSEVDGHIRARLWDSG